MSTAAQWTAASETDDAALVRAAKDGDADAAGVVIGRWHGMLAARARAIAVGRIDPEDLLASAIVGLLDLWRRGAGPDDGVAPYLIRAMRNAVIDAARSPRSRELSLDELEDAGAPVAAEELPAWRDAELRSELELVRRAFAALPSDQRTVLRELVVHDRKPAQLAVELDRTAPAISSLALRAKRSLRRRILVEHLGDGGESCRENAETLPETVRADPVEHAAGERGLAHVRECPRCRRNWARFAAFGSAFGVIPAIVVAESALGPLPGAAAAIATPTDASGSAQTEAPSDGGRAPTAAGAAPAAAAVVSAGAVAAPSAPSAPTPGSVEAPASSTPGPAPTPAAVAPSAGGPAAVLAKRGVAVAAAAAAVLGTAGLVAAAVLGPADPSAFAVGEPVPVDPSLVAAFDVDLAASGSTGTIGIELSVPGAQRWRLAAVDIALAPTVRIVGAPGGWACPDIPGGGSCALTEDAAGSGELRLTTVSPVPELTGDFAIGIEAIADGSTRIRGSATGSLG